MRLSIEIPYLFETFMRRKGAEAALDAAQDMAINPHGFLVITGGKGTGKTHLVTAICRAWGLSEYQPERAGDLLDFWRSRYEDPGDFQHVFQTHCRTRLFALDDLGAERPTPWAVEKLTQFIDYRYSHMLPTVITTNLDENLMESALGGRIADRIFDTRTGRVRVVNITAESFRTGREW